MWGYYSDLWMCRLHQLAAKKGLEVDWVQSFQDRETSNSSGDQGTETAISLSRCVHRICVISWTHLTHVCKGLYYHAAAKGALCTQRVLRAGRG